MYEEKIESFVRQAIVSIVQGDTKTFVSMPGELERRGWDYSGIFIIEALLRATERLPAVGPESRRRVKVFHATSQPHRL